MRKMLYFAFKQEKEQKILLYLALIPTQSCQKPVSLALVSRSPASAPFYLRTKDFKKFYRKKVMVDKEVFVNGYNFSPVKMVIFIKVFNKTIWIRDWSGSRVRICGSVEPDPDSFIRYLENYLFGKVTPQR
jgi:hypothetical protein